MKTQFKLAPSVLLLFVLGAPLAIFAQGSLTPPGPPAPVMKSLDQIEPRIPISSVPITLANPGSYYLTTNVTGASAQSGITLSNNNITLDLNGFAMQGVPGALYAVAFPIALTNITIRNGSMFGWRMGVHEVIGNSRNVVIEDLRIFGSVSDGIDFSGFSQVKNCVCSSNGGIGISITLGQISGCTTAYNVNSGIELFGGGIVRDCWSGYNGNYGIEVGGGSVTGCWVQNNFWSGIQIAAPGSQVIGNTCQYNNSSLLSGYAGIYANDANNRIENNHVIGSAAAGIALNSSFGGNVVIKNSVTGNGASNYLVPGSQIVGPLITNTVSGFITNLNPWANFSY